MKQTSLRLLGTVGVTLLYLIWVYSQAHAFFNPEHTGFTIVAYVIIFAVVASIGYVVYLLLKAEYENYIYEKKLAEDRKTAMESLQKQLDKLANNDI